MAIECAEHLEDEELVPILRTFVQSKVPACACGSGSRGGGRAPDLLSVSEPQSWLLPRALPLPTAVTVGSGGRTGQSLGFFPVTRVAFLSPGIAMMK